MLSFRQKIIIDKKQQTKPLHCGFAKSASSLIRMTETIKV